MFELGELVEFRITDLSSQWMRGRVYATLATGLIIILVGSTFYDADPKNVRRAL